MTSLNSEHLWTESLKIHKHTEIGTRHFNCIEMFTEWWHPKTKPLGRKEAEMREKQAA